MADYVAQLSDAELRIKLAEYGFPVVPITATTRKVMAKKLRLLIENKSKTNAENRRSLAKYSSGEDSDNDLKVDVKAKEKNRRATTAGTMLPPPTSKPKRGGTPLSNKKAQNDVDTSNSRSDNHSETNETKTTTTRRYTRTQYLDDENDFSDSDIEIIEKSSGSANSSKHNFSDNHDHAEEPSPQRNTYFSPINNLKSGASDLRSSVFRGSGLRSYGLGGSSSSFNSPLAPKSSTPLKVPTSVDTTKHPTSRGSTALDDLNQIRARLSLGNSRDDRPSVATSSFTDRKLTSVSSSTENTIETPYFSDFTRRLSQMTNSRTPRTTTSTFKNDIIKENETNGDHFAQSFVNRFTTNRNRDISKEFKKSQEKNIFKNNVVSFTLVGIACIFFLALSFLYMGMRNDHVPILDIEAENIPYCNDDLLSKPGVNCIKKEHIPDALTLLKIIRPELSRRAANFKCADESKTTPHMGERSILEYVKKNTGFQDDYKIREDLANLQVLVIQKPELGISLIETLNVYHSTGDEPATTKLDVLANRATSNLALIDKNPELPLTCLLYLKLHTILSFSLIITAGGLVIFLGQFLVKKYMEETKNRNKKMFEMVEQIIDILSRNAPNEKGDNFLAVSHIRDMLIPVQDRNKMSSVWNSAVEFIENNESRVRSEVQIVAGEEYQVWRWLGTSAMNLSGNFSRGKVWQGQAFETQEGSVNSLPVSPTQCLKIRQMFDKNETAINWTTVIKDAILEKCGDDCKILHIGIDKATCCVYVKCASQSDAGLAYRNLHGWWYDGKLITVKYLRLERYLERFPDSPSSGPYLKPSNNKKLSLQNDWSSNEDN